MAGNKSSISKAQSYAEIGEYWDTYELPEDSEEVSFSVEWGPDPHRYYFAVDNSMIAGLRTVAKKRDVSAETLLNLWVREKSNSEMADG